MIEIKKETKQKKINTSMSLKPETIIKLDKISDKTGVSNSSIIDQIVKVVEVKGVDYE